MKMKKLSVALIAAGLMSSQVALASDGFATSESHNGLSFAFENSSTMNYATLSHTEMVETEGKVAWFGALGGFFGYTAYTYIADADWNAGEAASWSAAGATGGVASTIGKEFIKDEGRQVLFSTFGGALGYGASENIQNMNSSPSFYEYDYSPLQNFIDSSPQGCMSCYRGNGGSSYNYRNNAPSFNPWANSSNSYGRY